MPACVETWPCLIEKSASSSVAYFVGTKRLELSMTQAIACPRVRILTTVTPGAQMRHTLAVPDQRSRPRGVFLAEPRGDPLNDFYILTFTLIKCLAFHNAVKVCFSN